MDSTTIKFAAVLGVIVILWLVAFFIIYRRQIARMPAREPVRGKWPQPLYRGYNDLPLCVYSELLEAAKKPAEDGMPEILACLCGVPVEEIEALPLERYTELLAETDWIQRDPEPVKVRRNYYGGPDFSFRLFRDRAGLTFGQYTDLQSILAAKDLDARLPDILCIALVPEGHAYATGYDMQDARDAIDHYLSVSDALAIRDFFVKRLNRLTMRFLTCSAVTAWRGKRKARTPETRAKWDTALTKTMEAMRDFRRVGDGLQQSMTSPRLPVAVGTMLYKSLQ